MKESITNQQWENMCETVFSTTCSMYWREFSWKNLVRYFITPKMKPFLEKSQQRCWRGCKDNDANHFHIFWSCPKIHVFWKNIYVYLQQLFGKQISLSCLVLYLGDIPAGMMSSDKYLLKILTVAAKKAITRKWLQIEPPSVDKWLGIIEEIHEMERLTFLLRLRSDLYVARWSKWTAFLPKV